MIVYHEQVIRTLAALAGYDLTYADHVRRHLDDAEMLPGFRADFLARAIARGVDAGGRRADVGRRRPVRELRVLQGARGCVRGADVPLVVAEDPLSRAVPCRDPDPRPGHVPPAAAARRRPARRGADPAAGRASQRARVRHGRDRRTARSGIRIGLQDVHGISAADIRSIHDRAGRADRSATWGTSCGAPRCRGRSPRRSRTPARSTRCPAAAAGTCTRRSRSRRRARATS